MRLIDHVAQAIRIHDGDHSKGAAELAEIALTATSQFFQRQADKAPNQTLRTLNLVAADWANPDNPDEN
ncbi:hypothetical protein ACFYP4_02825 [Streptomyces sp. NPDC005551]|uniref:hypothetical protein n=1 Tax=Streptomyces sp. NPDC005551 TaxID=3364725 RepID=UPI0036A48FE8